MMLRSLVGLMSFMMLVFSGCAATSPTHESFSPISKILGTSIGTVYSLTPERRNIIMIPEPPKDFRICAEPSPDAAENIASTFRLLAQAQTKGFQLSGDLATAFAKSSVSLFTRSQGVQLFRDGMYNLCQAYMNGAIDGKQYLQQYEKLLNITSALIKEELPTLAAMKIILEPQIPSKSPIKPKKFSGKIESVDAGAKSIVVTSTDRKTKNTFVVDEKTTRISQDGMDLTFADLKKDMQVDVSYDKMEGNKATATAIKVPPPKGTSKVIEKISEKVESLTK